MRSALVGLAILASVGWAWMIGKEPAHVIGSFATSVEGRNSNQRHNAFLCLKKLRGRVIEPGETFSFNHVVGTWSRDQGYRKAPVSYNGKLIDSWGGGVCQTSTTLYNAALLAGLQIVERHAHRYAPSYIAPGRDAAVAFSHIDLRIRNTTKFPVVIQGEVTELALTVRLVSQAATPQVTVRQTILNRAAPQTIIVGAGPYGRIRNPGKTGFEVETWRYIGSKKSLVSHDQYPVMDRVTVWSDHPGRT